MGSIVFYVERQVGTFLALGRELQREREREGEKKKQTKCGDRERERSVKQQTNCMVLSAHLPVIQGPS